MSTCPDSTRPIARSRWYINRAHQRAAKMLLEPTRSKADQIALHDVMADLMTASIVLPPNEEES